MPVVHRAPPSRLYCQLALASSCPTVIFAIEVTWSSSTRPVSVSVMLGALGGLVSTSMLMLVEVEPTLPALSYQAPKLKMAFPSTLSLGVKVAV